MSERAYADERCQVPTGLYGADRAELTCDAGAVGWCDGCKSHVCERHHHRLCTLHRMAVTRDGQTAELLGLTLHDGTYVQDFGDMPGASWRLLIRADLCPACSRRRRKALE